MIDLNLMQINHISIYLNGIYSLFFLVLVSLTQAPSATGAASSALDSVSISPAAAFLFLTLRVEPSDSLAVSALRETTEEFDESFLLFVEQLKCKHLGQ
jgi:hypothetical protein